MGKSLSQTLGLSDPLDNAIHDFINPGAQPNNFKAPPWWGPVTPTGGPGPWSQHSAVPIAGLPAGLPPTVRPAGAPPAPAPQGFTPPPLVDGRLPRGAPPPAAVPAPAPPAALAAGLAPNPFAGARTFLNGQPVSAGTEAQAAFGGQR